MNHIGMEPIHTKEQAAFIARLKQAREEAGLTQIEVAKKLKRVQSYVSKAEHGDVKIDVVELNQFALLYRKDINYFLK